MLVNDYNETNDFNVEKMRKMIIGDISRYESLHQMTIPLLQNFIIFTVMVYDGGGGGDLKF